MIRSPSRNDLTEFKISADKFVNRFVIDNSDVIQVITILVNGMNFYIYGYTIIFIIIMFIR